LVRPIGDVPSRTPIDFDVAGISQLPPPQLAFCDHLEPGPLEVKRLDASFRCGRLID
jgi:hypothetical protein